LNNFVVTQDQFFALGQKQAETQYKSILGWFICCIPTCCIPSSFFKPKKLPTAETNATASNTQAPHTQPQP
jgi:hypothetical protein